MQIKNSEIAKYRNHYAAKQKYKCAICGCSLATGITTLDHCHETGVIRGTLCRQCNSSEGRTKKGAQYMAKVSHLAKTDYVLWLEYLLAYLKGSMEHPEAGKIHPTFDLGTGKQKPIKRKKRK